MVVWGEVNKSEKQERKKIFDGSNTIMALSSII